METRRKLDAARLAVLSAVLCCSLAAGQTADDLYQRGLRLSEQQQWAEAGAAFLEGSHAFPRDARFAVELGGVAFREKRFPEAIRWLRRADRLDPRDEYTNDFLGTLYFLEGNSQAALKYWNGVGKPAIAAVHLPERLRTDPILLDRAFAFAPGQLATLDQWRSSEARVETLGVFAQPQLRLDAREDGRFDATLSGAERNGFGAGPVDALATTLRGVGYRTLRPEYSNIGGAARNVETLLRWDPNKRRASGTYSTPFRGNPGRRLRLGLDLRDENWSLREGSGPELGALHLRRTAASAGVRGANGTWGWSLDGEASHRGYRDVTPWTPLPNGVLTSGWQVKQTTTVMRALRRMPERRFESSVHASAETGRLWADRSYAFEKLQAGIAMQWFPQLRGDDYAIRASLRGGQILGTVPFDELAILGLERDNPLPLRAHIGTQGGRKGSAPMGRRYAFANFEVDKSVYNAGWFRIALSPFFDAGRIDDSAGLGRRQWLFDTGVQAKVRLLGVSFTFVYGKDLRTGANAFYALDRATVVLPVRD